VDIELQLQIERELLSLHTKPRACASCQSVIAPLKSLAHLGDDRFVGTLIRVCKYRKVCATIVYLRSNYRNVQISQFAEPEQCEGDLSAQGPILAHDFRNIAVNGISAARLCNAIFGICEQPPVTSYEVKFPKPLPNHDSDERKKRKRRKARRPPFQVVHISDVHIDREYTVRNTSRSS
jgi:sphingomyelin phosphodiesterase